MKAHKKWIWSIIGISIPLLLYILSGKGKFKQLKIKANKWNATFSAYYFPST